MARYRFFSVALLLIAAAAVSTAQSNDTIDAILDELTATVYSAAYLTMTSAGLVDDDASPAQAFREASGRGWISGDAEGRAVTFGEFAYLLMRAHEVPGGLMYLLFPGPRYAAREFVYQGWSPERRGPNDTVSGEFLVRVTGNALEMIGGSR